MSSEREFCLVSEVVLFVERDRKYSRYLSGYIVHSGEVGRPWVQSWDRPMLVNNSPRVLRTCFSLDDKPDSSCSSFVDIEEVSY